MNADTGVPDILLERYRLNELPNDEADRLAALLAHDSRLRERLAALEASDEAMSRGGLPDRVEAGDSCGGGGRPGGDRGCPEHGAAESPGGARFGGANGSH